MSTTIPERSTGRATPDVSTPRLVGCILTLDEERNIRTAVTSMARVADVVFVVDSFSTDRTCEIAETCGAVVAKHSFESYAAQRNWALDQIADRWGDDVLAFTLDADEWLADGLVDELETLKTNDSKAREADIYIVPVRRRFDGRILRHGGFGRTWSIRMWRAGYTAYGARGVNEALTVPDSARLAHLSGWLEHADVDSWDRYIQKHNLYSTVEAEARLEARENGRELVSVTQAVRDRTVRRRFVRQRIWDRLPGGAKPAMRFVQIFLVSGGFLDRKAGFERALFEAWQEMCVDLKVAELERNRGARVGAP